MHNLHKAWCNNEVKTAKKKMSTIVFYDDDEPMNLYVIVVYFHIAVGGSGLDIMLLTGNQDVSGSITFLDMWLDGSSLVSGLIDGVDVPALAADAVYTEGNQTISGSEVRLYGWWRGGQGARHV